MKKIICKKVYDTETAEIIHKDTFGEFGSATGYEETLYKAPEGYYFLYTNGGSQSKYTTESITRISKENAQKIIDEKKS